MNKKRIILIAVSIVLAAVIAVTCAIYFTVCAKNDGGVHRHSYKVSVIEPTCTEQGYTLHSCECGDSYKDKYTDALNHNFINYVSDENATCTQDGTKTAKCSRCDEKDTVTDEDSAHGHNFVDYVCTYCGETDPDMPVTQGFQFTEITKNGEVVAYCVSGGGILADDGIMIIPSTNNGLPVRAIGQNAFSYSTKIKSVLIPASVTSIGEGAFFSSSGLTKVKCNGIVSIGNLAFRYCDKLESVTFGNDLESIGNNAFEDCNSLTGITIPDKVKSIGANAFYNCSAATGELKLPDSLTSIGVYAFSGCSSLTGLILGNGIESIGSLAFLNCTSLTGELKLPDSLKSIDSSAFQGCAGLTGKLTISDNVTFMGTGVFKGCSGLTAVSIGKGITSIPMNSFEGCTGLKEAVLPEGVSNIFQYAFYGCRSLTGIAIPDSVTKIGDYAFQNCTELTEMEIPNGLTSIGKQAFYFCSKLAAIRYDGTLDEWAGVSKGTSWNSGTAATFIVNCSDGTVNKMGAITRY